MNSSPIITNMMIFFANINIFQVYYINLFDLKFDL